MLLPTDASGRTRLLPASIPFRFFAAAGAFHLAGWCLLLVAPAGASSFSGGLGAPLAALHAITLGVLVMAAAGASLQLLPVATVQPVLSITVAKAIWWILVPANVALLAGMATVDTATTSVGAVGAGVALTLYAGLLAVNLARARRRRAMIVYAWASLAALVGVLATGPALALHYRYGIFADAQAVAGVHLVLACYGFLGMLVCGFSYLLVSMFMVRPAPPERDQYRVLAAAVVAIVAMSVALIAGAAPAWRIVAGAIGFTAAIAHVAQMFAIAARRRTRDAPWSLWLMRLGWGALPAGVALGTAVAAFEFPPRVGVLFGVVLVIGWILSFVLAVVLRIVPFLASVHVKIAGGKLPLVSALTPARAGWAVAALHTVALALLAVGVAAESDALLRAAGASGAAGAAAMIGFLVGVLRRARAAIVASVERRA